jgi:nitrite reductase/ring-hydroxylating ferredoxin subunit
VLVGTYTSGTSKGIYSFRFSAETGNLQPLATPAETVAPPIAVFNVEGSYFAISDVCTHDWARLSDGEVDGETVICPLHRACFSLSTGEALSLPAIEPVETFAVILQGDDIYVEL